MSFHIKVGVTALALILAPLTAAAEHKASHDGGNGRGHASQEERGNRGNAHANRDQRQERSDEEGEEEGGEVAPEEEAAGSRPCAWGLARRDTPCVPPGQAAKGVTTEEWIGAPESTFDEAEDLTGEDGFGLIANEDQLGLPDLPEGQAYALAGDAIVVVDVTEGLAEDGVTPTSTYTYASTVRRAAFPGQSGD